MQQIDLDDNEEESEKYMDAVNCPETGSLLPSAPKKSKTPAERQRKYRLRRKEKILNDVEQENRRESLKRKNQNQQKSRAEKRIINKNKNKNIDKPDKKSRADYQREYRLRKKNINVDLNSDLAEVIPRQEAGSSRFPTKECDTRKWITTAEMLINQKPILSKEPRICCEHFTPDEILNCFGTITIKYGAVPTIFPNADNKKSAQNTEHNMSTNCCVIDCTSTNLNDILFPFPTDEDQLKKWIVRLGGSNIAPGKALVCSKHFLPHEIVKYHPNKEWELSSVATVPHVARSLPAYLAITTKFLCSETCKEMQETTTEEFVMKVPQTHLRSYSSIGDLADEELTENFANVTSEENQSASFDITEFQAATNSPDRRFSTRSCESGNCTPITDNEKPKKRKNNNAFNVLSEKKINKLIKVCLDEAELRPNDEFQVFGDFIAQELRKLSSNQKIYKDTTLKIQQALVLASANMPDT